MLGSFTYLSSCAPKCFGKQTLDNMLSHSSSHCIKSISSLFDLKFAYVNSPPFFRSRLNVSTPNFFISSFSNPNLNRTASNTSSFRQSASVPENASTLNFEESSEEILKKSDVYFQNDNRPIILFDGVCNFCNAGVNFLLENDNEGKVRLCALQSDAGKRLLVRSNRLPHDISSVVLVEKSNSYIKSDAVLRTASYLNFPFPPFSMLAFLIPMFFRDTIYDVVADNRYNILGMRDECRFYDESYGSRFVE